MFIGWNKLGWFGQIYDSRGTAVQAGKKLKKKKRAGRVSTAFIYSLAPKLYRSSCHSAHSLSYETHMPSAWFRYRDRHMHSESHIDTPWKLLECAKHDPTSTHLYIQLGYYPLQNKGLLNLVSSLCVLIVAALSLMIDFPYDGFLLIGLPCPHIWVSTHSVKIKPALILALYFCLCNQAFLWWKSTE